MTGRTELDAMRHSIDLLTHGLTAIVETQATQTEMIRQLLEAATAPIEPDRETGRMLRRIADRLVNHGIQLRAIGVALDRLPAAVGASVAHEVTRAMTQVK